MRKKKKTTKNTYLSSIKGDAKGVIKKRRRTRKRPPKAREQWMLSWSTGSTFRKEELPLLAVGCPHPFSSF